MSVFSDAGIPDLFAPGVGAAFVLTALRVGGLVLVAPVWSAKMVPMRLRTALIVIFAVLLLPVATTGMDVSHLRITPSSFLQESAIGFVIGLAAALVIAAAEAGGELMTVTIGLSGAAIFDPVNNTQGAILAQFMQIIALTVLLIGGGHLVMIRALGDSFRVMPLGAPIDYAGGFHTVVVATRSIFSTGLQFAAPVIAAVLITNVALAVTGRAAPQLNIMSVAFPLQIGLGLMTFAGSIALVIHVLADWTPGFNGNLESFARAATGVTAGGR